MQRTAKKPWNGRVNLFFGGRHETKYHPTSRAIDSAKRLGWSADKLRTRLEVLRDAPWSLQAGGHTDMGHPDDLPGPRGNPAALAKMLADPDLRDTPDDFI